MTVSAKPIRLLLCEDSETDAELTLEALRGGRVKNTVFHVRDGEEAMKFLRHEPPFEDHPLPDLLLLDLNMPKMDGREVLRTMKQDAELKVIPVIVLTTSEQDQDILESYGLSANSYIVKPVELDAFFDAMQRMQEFWVEIVKLPTRLGEDG